MPKAVGEQVLPGLYRLRIPLPWPGVSHCNAWALTAADQIVLVDTGANEPGGLDHLEDALAMVGFGLVHVTTVICTHAHADHYGLAAPILARTGAELWLHSNHAHATSLLDSDAIGLYRTRVARRVGIPRSYVAIYVNARLDSKIAGFARPDRTLVTGTVLDTDLGTWRVHETPGHAPSHVCLHQPEAGVLLSGDHVLPVASVHFEYGWSADPISEFLASLDLVAGLDCSLGAAGHGRPFVNVHQLVQANRDLVRGRLAVVHLALDARPRTAFEIAQQVAPSGTTDYALCDWAVESACYLGHLARAGKAACIGCDDALLWAASSSREC